MYKEVEKMKVVKYACSHGVTNGFSEKSSLIWRKILWVLGLINTKKKFRKSQQLISQTRGRPLLLPPELDEKLSSFHNKPENRRRDHQQTCYLRNFNGSYQDWHGKVWVFFRFCSNLSLVTITVQQNERVSTYGNNIKTHGNIFSVGRS